MTQKVQRLLFIGGFFVAVVGIILVLVFGQRDATPSEDINLEFWGVYDDINYYGDIISSYKAQFPFINITYKNKPFDSYEKELIDAFAAGVGPDIWSMHNTWLPKHKDKITPLPQGEGWTTMKEFRSSFTDVALQDLVFDNEIYGLPVYIDTLALYWNKDIFQTNGLASPPETWDDFISDINLLVRKDRFGNIIRAGASIGTARNVNRSTDILSLLMMQTGTQMNDPVSFRPTFNQFVSLSGQPFGSGEEALRFYTDFADPQKEVYTWNSGMDYSIDAFYQGKSAMMLSYSHHIETIKNKAPYLNFGTSFVPQIDDREFDTTYANYWVPTVSEASENSIWAWHFLQFMASQEESAKYLEKSKRPTARRGLIETQKDDVYLGVFADQILTARSWYQIDNVAIENIFADMIDSVVLGQATVKQAIDKSANQVNVFYRK